ncbi:MAG: hypothetical protein MK132_13675 [Lentisphaerales bacterium]|nr:hypothetical protein [Lentisphaerales bacterium]
MKTFLILIISFFLIISCSPDKTSKANIAASHENCDHDHGDHEGHEHDDHDNHEGYEHNDHEGSNISRQALKNMGVTTHKMSLGEYTIFNPVPAIIVDNPLNEQPIFAPFGGRIKSINLALGEYKETGHILLTMYRDPIKRPELKMVEEILTPASEEFHTAISSLRQNLKSKEVLQSELTRLEKFQKQAGDLSIVPQKDLIDLKYEIEKVHSTIEGGRKKLELHGLNKKEITSIENGQFSINLYRIWKNSLKSNNIWNTKADTILELLDNKVKNNHWTVATIGELVAQDILSEELLKWFQSDSKTSKHFLEISSLIQQGHTIEDIEALYQLGVFNSIIQIYAPAANTGWEVESLSAKIGQRVTAGQKLLTLRDQSLMQLVASPQASETVDMANAAKKAFSVAAVPLTAKSGPKLQDLQINQIRGLDDGREQVIIAAKNSILSKNSSQGKNYRIWSLRAGQKYILKVPTSKLQEVITVPLEAIVKHGAETVIFVQVGNEFIRKKVSVLHQDSEHAVLSKDSELKIGDTMVITGAFALQQALIAGTPQAVDPHAGHNH